MGRSFVNGLVLGVVASFGFASAGHAVAWSPPTTIAAGASVGEPQLATSYDTGTSVIAWQSDSAIFARRVTAGGKLGGKRRLSSATEGEGPQVAVGPSGAVVVVWSGAGYTLRARRISADGKVGPVRKIASGYGRGTHNTSEVDVAMGGDGVATIAWSQVIAEPAEPKGLRILSARVHVRRLASDGRLSPAVELPPAGAENRAPRVAVDRLGRATVCWAMHTDTTHGVRAVRVERGGAIGPVHEISSPKQYWPGGGPEIVMDAAGRATVIWADSDALIARRIGVGGSLGTAHVLAQGGSKFGARAAVDAAGRVVVAWRDATSGDLVRARRIAGDGTLGPLLTLMASPGATSDPDVAVDPVGAATVVWSESRYRRTGEGNDHVGETVRVRRIGADGHVGSLGTLARPAMSPGISPHVGAGRGALTIAWQTWRPRRSAIKAVRQPYSSRAHARASR